MKKYVLAVAAVFLLSWFVAGRAPAQIFAPGEVPYLRVHAGASSYMGDRSRGAFFTDRVGLPSLGVEFGYRYRTRSYGVNLGFSYIGATYQQINEPFAEGYDPIAPEASSLWRHTLAFVGQLGFRPDDRLDPYLRLGVGTTFGRVNTTTSIGRSEYEMAFSLILGGGVEFALTDRLGLFAEADFISASPNDNLDKAERSGFFDVLGFYGVGLRYDIGHLRLPDFDVPSRPPVAEAPPEPEPEPEPEPAPAEPEPEPAPDVVPVQVLALDGPAALQVGSLGTFTAEINEGEADGPFIYVWNFGDGATSTGLETTHRFNIPGTYVVTFTASGDYNTATDSLLVNVARTHVAGMPEVLSLYSMQDPTAVGAPVRFNARVRGDVPLSYTWDFGDGTTITGGGLDPSHTYQAPGRYEVTLSASNNMGRDTVSVTQHVHAAACFAMTSLPPVHFEAGSAELSSAAREVLQRNLDLLEQCPNLSVRVEGYATTDEQNARRLADARAEAVEAFYLEEGLAPERLQSFGLGAPSGPQVETEEFRRVDSVLVPN